MNMNSLDLIAQEKLRSAELDRLDEAAREASRRGLWRWEELAPLAREYGVNPHALYDDVQTDLENSGA